MGHGISIEISYFLGSTIFFTLFDWHCEASLYQNIPNVHPNHFLKHYIMSRLKFFSCSAWGRHKVEANILKKYSINSKAWFIFELFRLTENNVTKKNRDILRRDSEPLALRKGFVILWILNSISQRNFEFFNFPCCEQLKQ